MKKIKYMLFTFVILFIASSNIDAKTVCRYGDEQLYLECTIADTGNYGTCTIGGNGKDNVQFEESSNKFLNSAINECNEIYVVFKNNGSTITNSKLTIRGLYRTETEAQKFIDQTALTLYKDNYHKYSKMDKRVEQNVTTELSSYDGNGCIYTNGVFKYVCEIVNGSYNCELGCADGSRCGNSYNISSAVDTFTNADFLDNNNFVCSEKVYACINESSVVTKLVKTKTECGDANSSILNYSSNANNFDGEKYVEVSTVDWEEESGFSDGNNTGGGRYEDPAGDADDPEEDSEELDLEHFCKGAVQGVFTTLGWVFFILKIAVPLILIIFGSIDLAKAVLASKDDEIKKSVKTLVMRAIAGIIIFFIPTFLKFVVSVFDKDNVYNGTFSDCTECMLDPNHKFKDGTTCSGLRGE